jgi:hypothetical protein
MVSEQVHYPLSKKKSLRLWEWHLVLYWNTVLRDFPKLPLAHLEQLPAYAQRMEVKWKWVTPSRMEMRSWRLRFLSAKLGLTRAILVEDLPEWLVAVVSIRFLDESLLYFGRPMKTFPARATAFQLA